MSYSIEQRDEQLFGTDANIVYELEFDRAPQHLVRVRMKVKAVSSDNIVLVMPAWTPGSYKIRNYIGYQGNVAVSVLKGGRRTDATFRWRDLYSLEIQTTGASEVELEYLMFGHERSVRTNHINRFHAFIVPAATLMFVEGRQSEVHHVYVKTSDRAWQNITTQLSPVDHHDGNGQLFGALNYDVLADSPLEIGNHTVEKFDVKGARHEVAIASVQSIDAKWIVEQMKVIVEVESSIFGSIPYDRYVFIIHAYPGVGGGLEHARSSVNAVDPVALTDKTKGAAFLSLLCHEYFHLWNIKRIRPEELGPFDYTKPNLTTMLWMAEGVTSYYDDLLAYRCGFYTEKDYLDLLASDRLSKLDHVPGRFAVSVRESSYLAWLKLYHDSPDGGNRFPSYYLKGGLIFLMLDLYIIDHTDGKTSLDDGLRALWKRYTDDPARGVSEAETIAILERATGVQLREKLLSWLDGKSELPYAESFEPFGIAVTVEPKTAEAITFGEKRSFAPAKSKAFCGWRCADQNGRVIVKSVEDGSPAQLAGIGIEDEVVSVATIRVNSVTHLEELTSAFMSLPAKIVCQCDGQMYETTITPRPVTEYKLKVNTESSSRQNEMRERWLLRKN